MIHFLVCLYGVLSDQLKGWGHKWNDELDALHFYLISILEINI